MSTRAWATRRTRGWGSCPSHIAGEYAVFVRDHETMVEFKERIVSQAVAELPADGVLKGIIWFNDLVCCGGGEQTISGQEATAGIVPDACGEDSDSE